MTRDGDGDIKLLTEEELLEAYNGLKRRYGPKTEGFSLTDQEQLNFVEINASATARKEGNHFLATEVKKIVAEIRIRIADGRMDLPSEKEQYLTRQPALPKTSWPHPAPDPRRPDNWLSGH